MAVFPPPILPEPITLEGCAAEAPYDARIRFIRRVALFSSGSLIGFGLCVLFWMMGPYMRVLLDLHPQTIYLSSIASLFALILTRKAGIFSQLLLAFAFFVCWSGLVAVILFSLKDAFPGFVTVGVILFFAVALGFGLYAIACGHDYSHVGSFVLVALFAVLVGVSTSLYFGPTFTEGGTLILLALAGNLYWHYDLAMILRRRRLNEPVAAVVDLYRDILNCISYPIRVIRHQKERPKVQLRW